MRYFAIFGSVALLLMLTTCTVSADFADGLILYLPFDEGEGDIAKDLSGNKHDGKIDLPEWVDGKFGKALKFLGDGSGTFVTVESTPILNVNEMAVMAWINADHWNGVRQIVGKSVHGGCGGRMQYGLFSENNNFVFRLETEAGRVDVITPLPDVKKWAHITATNNGKEAKVYFDGKEVGKGQIAGKLFANADPLRVAQDCDRPNYIFAGLIDEVRLWNRPLSEAEINTFKDLDASGALAVQAQDKLSTAWARIKSR
jgi:hypothetical protein